MFLTFFIGNGFDLQNNLPTTFNDFFNSVSNNATDDNYIYRKYNEDENKEYNWSDFESTLGKITYDVTDNKDEDKVLNTDFMEDLEVLREDFIKYMNQTVSDFKVPKDIATKSINHTLKNFHNDLEQKHKEKIKDLLKKTNTVQVRFVNFNYTNTLKQFLQNNIGTNKIGGNNFNITSDIHIHRTLNDGTFLGLNDHSQLNSDVFNNVMLNSLIKPLTNNDYGGNEVETVNSIINRSSVIFIFGMSLGETDKVWWQSIGKWLQGHKMRYLIINDYKIEFTRLNPQYSAYRYLQYKDLKREEFLSHLDITYEEKEILKKQIFITFNTKNIFPINNLVN